jgi:hypothetical protein
MSKKLQAVFSGSIAVGVGSAIGCVATILNPSLTGSEMALTIRSGWIVADLILASLSFATTAFVWLAYPRLTRKTWR